MPDSANAPAQHQDAAGERWRLLWRMLLSDPLEDEQDSRNLTPSAEERRGHEATTPR